MSEDRAAYDNVTPFPRIAEQPDRLYWRPMDIHRATGLSVGFIYEALYRGDLLGYQMNGKTWLVPTEEMHRWIREGGKAADAEEAS